MPRKVYAIMTLLIVLASGTILWQRHSVESRNKQVALFMDGTDLLYRSRMLNLDLETYLEQLKQAGLYGVASHVTPLLDLEALGDVLMKAAGNEASVYARTLGLPDPLLSQSILEIKVDNLRDPLIALVTSLTTGQVKVYGNSLTAISFVKGIAYQELSLAELEFQDPNYPVSIAIVACKNPA